MDLKEYLEKNNITITQAANQLGCSVSHILLISTGHRFPGSALTQDIINWTGGAVGFNDLNKKRPPKKWCPCCGRRMKASDSQQETA